MEIKGVNITHPDKILFPEKHITKGTMVAYYDLIAPWMLPYIKDRPLSLKQFPAGITGTGFYHKHAAGFFPNYIPIYKLPLHQNHGKIDMIGAATARDLVYMAGQNAIEFHMPLSKAKTIDKPDQIILDFDPSDNDFENVRKLALLAKDILTERKIDCFVKTTGSRGLHIHIPFKARLSYDEVKPIAKELAEYIQMQRPDIATTQIRKNKRDNKVFIDYLRNDYAATAIAPYSLRANQDAGIAMPIAWEELKIKNLNAQSFTINNVQKRLKNFEDPWQDFTC